MHVRDYKKVNVFKSLIRFIHIWKDTIFKEILIFYLCLLLFIVHNGKHLQNQTIKCCRHATRINRQARALMNQDKTKIKHIQSLTQGICKVK